MPVAILAPNRIQDQQDFGSTPGAGNSGYAITWNNSTSRFVLTNVSGGSVSSVFGRTGAVVAASGDYTAAQVTNAAAVNAANTFSAAQKINVNSTTALFVEQDGVKDNVLVVDTTNARVGINGAPTAYPLEVFGASPRLQLIDTSNRDWYFRCQDGTAYIGDLISGDALSIIAGGVLGTLNQIQFPSSGNLTVVSDGIPQNYIYIGGAGHAVFDVNHYGEFRVSYNASSIGVATSQFSVFSTGNVAIGGITPSARLHVATENAVTNAITNIQILGHNSTGTPAAGFGAGLKFTLESSTTADQDAARLVALWDVATHASRSAALKILISGSGGEVDAAQFDDDATAGNTRMLLYDVDNGQLERVSVGAADSGGTGYKVLRIAN